MSLLQAARFEIIPLKSAEGAIAALPPHSEVSVTCSPAKGIGATIELTERVVAAGHHAVPHVAARMVEGPEHTARLAADFRRIGVKELFLVGGDQPDPLGPYTDGLGFLTELLKHDHGLTAAGLNTFVSTQMCFDTNLFEKWLRAERRAGFTAPIHLGVPGVIDKIKLMTMGARLGVGSSLRFLKKNRSTMGRLLMPGGYEPSELVNALEPVSEELDIAGLHLFTFNEVAATATWRDSLLATAAT
jgi:methylenetetrahydrofolate reductase (NADPH)